MKRLAAVLLLTACSAVPSVPHASKHRGVSYAAASPRFGTYGSPQSAASLVNGAASRQWEIARDAPANPDAQRIAYEAFFEAVWTRPWVLGAYPWKWFSYPQHGRAEGNDYDFESKPAAAAVIRRAYEQSGLR